MGLKIMLFWSATVANDIWNMKATKSKMAIGAVVLLRETIRDAEEKQGFNGLAGSR